MVAEAPRRPCGPATGTGSEVNVSRSHQTDVSRDSAERRSDAGSRVPSTCPGNLVGYARVSTEDQTLQAQLDDLGAAGCVEVFSDIASGASAERSGLDAALAALQPGDTLLVWRLDRLGRSLPHLVEVVSGLRERGVHFRSLRDGGIDTTTASGELIFHIFAALAQFERQLIRERTQAGLRAARARGRKGGRRPIPPGHPRVEAAKSMHAAGVSVAQICAALGVGRSTVYRYLSLS